MSPEFRGQHFLVNRNIARKMVRLFSPGNNPILEIGAGKGILSELLLEFYPQNQVVLVEIDNRLYSRLSETFGHRCHVLQENILNVRLPKLPVPGKFSLIGNIPYYLSKKIIDWAIGQSDHFKNGMFMMQKEFADKLIPGPPHDKSSARCVMFNYRFQPKKVMEVNPGSFSPPPSVQSSIFSFTTKTPDPHITDNRDFYRFLRTCFGSRRKTLVNNLIPYYGKEAVEQLCTRPGIQTLSRADRLDLEDFIRIYSGLPGNHRLRW